MTGGQECGGSPWTIINNSSSTPCFNDVPAASPWPTWSAKSEQERPVVREVARKLGLTLEIVGTRGSSTGYDEAFAAIAHLRRGAGAAAVSTTTSPERTG